MKQLETFNRDITGIEAIEEALRAKDAKTVRQYRGKDWVITGVNEKSENHATVTYTELVQPRPSGMQYAVLQGRMPQDGSKPDTALILFPAWVSATLLCAGVCGRVIELTDGSIIEGAVIPTEGTEQDLLDEIRSELGGAQQRVTEVDIPPLQDAPKPVQVTCVHGEPGLCADCHPPKRRYAEGRELEQAYEEALDKIVQLEGELARAQHDTAQLRIALDKIRKSAKKALN